VLVSLMLLYRVIAVSQVDPPFTATLFALVRDFAFLAPLFDAEMGSVDSVTPLLAATSLRVKRTEFLLVDAPGMSTPGMMTAERMGGSSDIPKSA